MDTKIGYQSSNLSFQRLYMPEKSVLERNFGKNAANKIDALRGKLQEISGSFDIYVNGKSAANGNSLFSITATRSLNVDIDYFIYGKSFIENKMKTVSSEFRNAIMKLRENLYKKYKLQNETSRNVLIANDDITEKLPYAVKRIKDAFYKKHRENDNFVKGIINKSDNTVG